MRVPALSLHVQGPQCSRLVIGAWRLAEWRMTSEEVLIFLNTCVDLGITTIDHADIYGNYTCEALFGAALQKEPRLRDRLQLVSKCGIKLVSAHRPQHQIKHYDTSRAHILASVDNSLQQLHTDYLDLLLIHRPDPLMNADETAEALMSLIYSGKVRYVGVSNFTPSQFELLASRLNVPLVTNQIEISVLHLEPFLDGTLDQCQRLKIAPMAWSPLGGGALFHSSEIRAKRLYSSLTEVGQELGGLTADQVALAWLLTHPANIIPLLGTGNLDRIRVAAIALETRLTREQWFKIWSASTGTDVP
ncbi:MAG: aldo/keto reductase [Oculatellaceae cyanobacterium bins.114]|nr:aldo/keto reductase [Oculatellaceae cyanobacterium bins.114]